MKMISISNKFYQIKKKFKNQIFYQRDKIHKILYKNKYYQNSKFKKKYQNKKEKIQKKKADKNYN